MVNRSRKLERLGDDELLERRFDSLDLSLTSKDPAMRVLQRRIQRLMLELSARGLRFQPHVWLSSEFFSPDGVPGIALPFYLAHPRLMRLERSQTMECEGQSERECMRILRHEAGHTVDSAFALSRRPQWRELFGLRSDPYLRNYSVKPSSTAFVRHLPRWYAQSHPAEDFAETFAVWLNPGSRWRSQYPHGLARRKLEWMDEVMGSIAGHRPSLRSREQTESIQRSRETLGEHYEARARLWSSGPDPVFGAFLDAAFDSSGYPLQRSSAAALLLNKAAAIQVHLGPVFRNDRYSLDQVLLFMSLHCRRRGLKLSPGKRGPSAAKIAGWVDATLRSLRLGSTKLSR